MLALRGCPGYFQTYDKKLRRPDGRGLGRVRPVRVCPQERAGGLAGDAQLLHKDHNEPAETLLVALVGKAGGHEGELCVEVDHFGDGAVAAHAHDARVVFPCHVLERDELVTWPKPGAWLRPW